MKALGKREVGAQIYRGKYVPILHCRRPKDLWVETGQKVIRFEKGVIEEEKKYFWNA